MIDLTSIEPERKINVPKDLPEWDGRSLSGVDPGFWTGTGDALKSIFPNVALSGGSALEGTYSGTIGADQIAAAAAEAKELGIPIKDPQKWAEVQLAYMDQSAKEMRRLARERYTPDPATTGAGAQIIHGVGTELTKATIAAIVTMGNPALVYGAWHGIEKTQALKDAGVDEDTANWAGVAAFGWGSLGIKIPAAYGTSRLQSAVFGATVNPVTNIGEDQTIKTILERNAYEKQGAEIDPFDPVGLSMAALMGGGFGALGWKGTPRARKEAGLPAQERGPGEAAGPVVDVSEAIKRAGAEAPAGAQAPVAPTVKAAAAPDVAAVQEASSLRMAEGGVILQNRNRGTASSVAQMQAIAGNPQYNRVSISRDFAQGAPVIAYAADLPEEQYGRTERVSASDGSVFEMRYAVVEADDIQTSNLADGSRNPDYGTVPRHVAIAGNGRLAGLSAAYERGTAGKYKEDMIADAAAIGVNPEVIRGMKQPVLVRIMSDRDASRADIAMLSNQSGTKALDATEQAENDSAVIDVSKLTFDEEGGITGETVHQFVTLLPDNSALVDKQSMPNTLAKPRLERAIFQRAYGNANLTSLLTDTDSAGGRIVGMLLRLAPKLMHLEDAGDMDFRDALVEAVNEIYVAKAVGQFKSLRELAATQPMGRSPEAQAFLDYFATVPGQIKGPTEVFTRLADWCLEVKANSDPSSMFFADDAPVPTRADMMMMFQDLSGVEIDPQAFALLKKRETRLQKEQRILNTVKEKLRETGRFTDEQIDAQAVLIRNLVMNLADSSGVDPEIVLPSFIVRPGEDSPNLESGPRVSSEEDAEFHARINDWISAEVLENARGKTREQLAAELGNDPRPIAYIPEKWKDRLFTGSVTDNRVYTGKGYFVDHVVNHHGSDVAPEMYLKIQDILNAPDEVLLDKRPAQTGVPRDGVIFVKRMGNNYLLAVNLTQMEDGRIQLYKSLSRTEKKRPYPKLERVSVPEVRTVHEERLPRYSRTSKEAPGGNGFPTLDTENSVNQNGKGVKSSGDSFNQIVGTLGRQVSVPVGEELVTVHNITGENLQRVNSLGGLAMPSLGITKASNVYSGFGEIGLIGTKDMVDPGRGVPVYGADAWTATFPPLTWLPDQQKYRQLLSDLVGALNGTVWDRDLRSLQGDITRANSPESAKEAFLESIPAKLLFLKERGETVEDVYSGTDSWSGLPYFDKEATAKAIDEKVRPYEAEFRQWADARLRGMYSGPSVVVGGKYAPATLDNVVEAMKETQHEGEGIDTLGALRGAVARRFLKLEDIQNARHLVQEGMVRTMQLVDHNEDFGRFMTTMQTSFESRVDSDTVIAALRKAAETGDLSPESVRRAMEDEGLSEQSLRKEPITEDYVESADGWMDEDSVMRLISVLEDGGDVNPHTMDELANEGSRMLTLLKDEFTDYFEAKPERAVKLNEFAGAVIPDNTSPEVRQILKDAGIRVAEYPAEDEGARKRVTKEFTAELQAERGDVVYQKEQKNADGAAPDDVRGAYSPKTNTIFLFKPDVTTALHEAAHAWLTAGIAAARQASSNLQIRRDIQIVFRDFGIKGFEEWDALGTEGQRRFQERFAAYMEEYLATGRAKNDEVRGVLERFRKWIADAYRDFKAHLRDRHRSEFGEDLPEMSSEVRDLMERILTYEDKADAVQRDFSPTAGQVDAARYAAFEKTVRADQPVDQSDPAAMQASLQAEAQAREALDNGERVSVSAPADADILENEAARVRENMGVPDSVQTMDDARKAPKQEDLPVHQLPTAEEEAPADTGMSDMFGGDEPAQPEQGGAAGEKAVATSVEKTAAGILAKHPELQVTPDQLDPTVNTKTAAVTARELMERVDSEASEIENFARVLGTAAECVLRNGGIKNA